MSASSAYAYFDVELSMGAYQNLIRDVQQGRSSQATASQVAYDIDREAMRDRVR
jgi:hypothetical protein